ncbi:hypothetical protein RI844_03275 [Thalassotalea fonticola]|uniref:DUF4390 domain-containing protein n=1 Tax=Thalassotalea fonticola TaxID=3065649 RepID=A0ABZ0GS66_9GAMM|nr:hypothetical protein RI844_03275 [Colwelliaceae bacterium S1-1]
MLCCQNTFTRLVTLLGMIIFSNMAYGVEIEHRVMNNSLMVTISDINYPQNLIENELTSGLPNNFTVIFSVKNKKGVHYVKSITYQITFDLWDEIYLIKTISDNVNSDVRTLSKKADIIDFINKIRFESAEILTGLTKNQAYEITAQVLVNPVNTQRIEKIRRWIASSQGFSELSEDSQHNRSPRPISTPSASSSANVTDTGIGGSARPRFQKLFDQIMEQYMELKETPALWKSDVASGSILFKSDLHAN